VAESEASGNAWSDEWARPNGFALVRVASATFAFGIALDVIPLGDGSAARIAGVVFSCVALWQVLRVRQIRPPSAALLLLTVFTAWAALSVLWARVTHDAVERMMSYAQLILFLWLGWQVVRTSRDWRALAGGYVLGCATAAVASWMASLAGVSYLGDEWDPRYVAYGFDPNDMGVTLAIAVPLAVHLGVTVRGVWRVVWFSYLPLALSASVLTGSRGGAITMAVALIAATYVALRSAPRLAVPLGGLITVGVIAAALWVPPATWRRVATVREEVSSGTLNDRLPIWRAGLDVLTDHPLVGVGVGGFPDAVVPALGRGIVAHNTLLSVAVELGVTGLALFLGSFLAAIGASRDHRAARRLAVALIGTWFVGVASLSWEYRKTTWLVLLLAAAASALEDSSADEVV
jgi:O-antigen ligase